MFLCALCGLVCDVLASSLVNFYVCICHLQILRRFINSPHVMLVASMRVGQDKAIPGKAEEADR